MKRLLVFLLCPLLAHAAEWALMDGTNVVAVGQFTDAYRAEMSGRAGNANLFLPVLRPDAPSTQEFEVVEPAGWNVTPSNVVFQWTVRTMNTNELAALRDAYVSRVARELESRSRTGQWEPGFFRSQALQAEFTGKILQAYLLNTELLLLVTKAVGASALTNNLTSGERSRVVSLRNQLAFSPAPDFTQADKDRAVYLRNEIIKLYQFWKSAQSIRAFTQTNTTPVNPASSTNWPNLEIGE